MKTRMLTGWVIGIVLASGALAPGIAQNAVKPLPAVPTSDKTGAAALAPAVTAKATPAARAETTTNTSPAANPASGGSGAKAPAAILSMSPWFYEVERLAKAGIDDTVIFAYINNTAGTFNLTADQVIYLKKLGLSPQVINTMMDHDQEIISGARPLPTSAPPPFPAEVQAALAARLHPPSTAAAPASIVAPPSPLPWGSIIAPDDDADQAGMLVYVEPDDAPDQPPSAGPVRMPYPVKLNDPIVILRLPSFALPCW
jgi:hypothetical protein